MSIDPRQLASLLAVAQHGSFNRAAAARGISQPALSGSIAQLERRLAVPLLDRSQRGSTLTPYGEILVRHAKAMFAVLDQADEEVRLKRLGIDGQLRVGATPSLVLKFLPTVIARLCREYPDVSISITEGLDDELMPALISGSLDIVFAPLSRTFPSPPEIIEEALFDDSFALGVGPKSGLARRKSITLPELKDARWVLPGPGSAYRRHIEAMFTTAGLAWPENCVTTNSLALVESLVAGANRVTVISQLQTRVLNVWRVRGIRLRGGGERTIGMKRRRTSQSSKLCSTLAQFAHEAARME